MANEFLPFAGDNGANVLTQSAYAALAARTAGFSSGVAKSAELNKVWRQSSIMAAMIGQFIADNAGGNAVDDGTITNLLANFKKAVRAGSNGVVGSARRLAISVAAASATASLTADEVVVESALGGFAYRLANFNKPINLATTGAGGMDTGSAPASGYVGIYAIYNPTSDASALLAVNATSARAPNVYGGANMPSGYTASALVSVWPTNASGQLVIGSQADREICIANNTVLNTSTPQASLTSFSISGAVPPNAIMCRGDYTLTATATGAGTNAVITGSANEIGRVAISSTAPAPATGITISFPHIQIQAPQTLYYRAAVSSGTLLFLVNVVAYQI